VWFAQAKKARSRFGTERLKPLVFSALGRTNTHAVTRDPASQTCVARHGKHASTEVAALSVRSELDPNWILTGDRRGLISIWQWETYVPPVYVQQWHPTDP
jgi:hypothetical protein